MAEVRLAEFVADHLRRDWAPGRVDCLLTLADWMVWRGMPDAAPHLRGSYETEDGFREIIAAHGGAIPLVASCARRIGLRGASEPTEGCIAIIGSRTNIQKQFGAIRDGQTWRVRFADAFPAIRAAPLAIWDI